MPRIYYHKLVRDKIPDVIREHNGSFETVELTVDEFRAALFRKLHEEANELATATLRDHVVKEIGDVLDVVDAICALKNVSADELRVARERAMEKKGGFTTRTYLVWSGDEEKNIRAWNLTGENAPVDNKIPNTSKHDNE